MSFAACVDSALYETMMAHVESMARHIGIAQAFGPKPALGLEQMISNMKRVAAEADAAAVKPPRNLGIPTTYKDVATKAENFLRDAFQVKVQGMNAPDDVAAGKDPQSMLVRRHIINPEFWTRAALAGGGFGILGDFIAGNLEHGRPLGETLAGPLVGEGSDAINLAGEAAKAIAGEKNHFARKADEFGARWAPGSTIWYMRAPLRDALGQPVESNRPTGGRSLPSPRRLDDEEHRAKLLVGARRNDARPRTGLGRLGAAALGSYRLRPRGSHFFPSRKQPIAWRRRYESAVTR